MGTDCHMTTVQPGQLGLSPSQKWGMMLTWEYLKGVSGEQGVNVKCILLIFASNKKMKNEVILFFQYDHTEVKIYAAKAKQLSARWRRGFLGVLWFLMFCLFPMSATSQKFIHWEFTCRSLLAYSFLPNSLFIFLHADKSFFDFFWCFF